MLLLIVALTGAAKAPSKEKWTISIDKLIAERGSMEKTRIDTPMDWKTSIPTEKSFVKCYLEKKIDADRVVSCGDGALLMKATCNSRTLEFSLEGSEKTTYFVKIGCLTN